MLVSIDSLNTYKMVSDENALIFKVHMLYLSNINHYKINVKIYYLLCLVSEKPDDIRYTDYVL